MALNWHLEWLVYLGARLAGLWREWRLPSKLAVGASVLVLGGMFHLGTIVTGHIRENVLQQSASAVALYMDSIVARHVQELATNAAMSDNNLLTLERLLSPASMHRPIVAFRVWKGDTVAFSNERDIVGKTYARTAARERAWQGHVAVEFEQPDGDDDEQVRQLKVPVLEVYAPVRRTGTDRIIALVETYEIAVELKNEVWLRQLWVWIAIAAIASTVIVLLFSMASSGTIERNSLLGQIGRLSLLQAESEQNRQRISQAGLRMCAVNERSLRSVGDELNNGPGQHVALALLKFDALEDLAAKANEAEPLRADANQEDLDAIRKALNDTLHHIRRVAGGVPPADIEDLSLTEILARAAARHGRRTGVAVPFQSRGLPERLSFPLKVALYRFVLEALDSTHTAPDPSLLAWCEDGKIMLEVVAGRGIPDAEPRRDADGSLRLRPLRDRIEAVGGKLELASSADGRLSLVAEIRFADVELASG